MQADYLGLDELALQMLTTQRAKQPVGELKKTTAVQGAKRGSKGSHSPSRWARGLRG